MKSKAPQVLIAASLLFIVACSAPPDCPELAVVNMDTVRMEIEALEAAYAEAESNKDVDALVAYYADDAHSLAPNEPTRVGKEAIRSAITSQFESDSSGGSIAFAITDIWAGGDYVTETGSWKVSGPDGSLILTGKYMSLFEKRDGKYVAIRDIWNSDGKTDDDENDDDDDDDDDKDGVDN